MQASQAAAGTWSACRVNLTTLSSLIVLKRSALSVSARRKSLRSAGTYALQRAYIPGTWAPCTGKPRAKGAAQTGRGTTVDPECPAQVRYQGVRLDRQRSHDRFTNSACTVPPHQSASSQRPPSVSSQGGLLGITSRMHALAK